MAIEPEPHIRFSEAVRAIASHATGSVLDNVERNLDRWCSHYERAAEDELELSASAVEAGIQSTTVLVLHQATHIAARVIGLTEALIDLINSGHVYAAPPVCRALHEQCCIPPYMALELAPRLKKQRTNDALRILFRLGLGAGPDAGFGFIRPIQVRSLNKAAERWLTNLLKRAGEADEFWATLTQDAYGPLSDLTHPNFRAMNPGFRVPGQPHVRNPPLTDDLLAPIVGPAGLMLQVGGEALTEVVLAAIDHPITYHGKPVWKEGDIYPGREPSAPASWVTPSQRGEV
jgi:hypothetical protein